MIKSKLRMTMFSFLVLCVGLQAGCGSTKEASQASQASQASDTSAKGKKSDGLIKIEVMQSGYGEPPLFIKEALDSKFGTDIQIKVGEAEYENQLNVRVSGGDAPDLFMVSLDSLRKYADMGVLLDMSPYMDKLPNYKKLAGETTVQIGEVKGKQYGLPKRLYLNPSYYLIRKDWLDKLNLKAPTTLDELLQVAEAFTNQDPDGNGKKDTYGMTGISLGMFNPILGAFGLSSFSNQFYLQDDHVKNMLYQPTTKDALSKIKQFIDAGVVDPEIMSNTAQLLSEKAFQGKAGIVYSNWTVMLKDDFVKIWKAANPNAEWIELEAPKGPNGDAFVGDIDIGKPGEMFAISKSVGDEPEKLNKIIEIMDYISHDEGSLLVQFGIKDKHFTMDANNEVKITELGKKEAAYSFLYQLTGRPSETYLKTKFPNLAANIDFQYQLPTIKSVDGVIQPPDGFNRADANRYIEEEVTKFIYGKRPIADYDNFLKKLESTFKYKAYMESAFEQLDKLGYKQ